MDFRMRISIFCCLAACLFMIAVPLVSEATYKGRGGEAARPTEGETVYVEVAVSDKVTAEGEASSTEETDASAESLGNGTQGEETAPPSDGEETEPADTDTSMTVTVLDADTGKNMTMSLEEYITCVVAAEMPYTFHTEALKAQAVAARSYCLHKIKNGLTHEGGADVCTSYAHCAAYVSEEELIEKYGESAAARVLKKVREAVEATAGEIVTYRGEPALALFHASSFGRTEASENVWGGKLPYLVSVSTPEEDSVSTVTVTDGELKKLFAASATIEVSAGKTGRLTSEINDSGRQSVLYYGASGLKAKKLRTLLGLRSCDFEYEKTSDGWLFTVHGHGHGVGMSQYGANAMAIEGKTYKEILTHYYTGVAVERIA